MVREGGEHHRTALEKMKKRQQKQRDPGTNDQHA